MPFDAPSGIQLGPCPRLVDIDGAVGASAAPAVHEAIALVVGEGSASLDREQRVELQDMLAGDDSGARLSGETVVGSPSLR